MQFKDRQHAGRQLAQALKDYQGADVVVYALPRGGTVLGYIVAEKLKAPFDLLIARKIGHPYNPEYAIAAVAENGEIVKNEAEAASVSPKVFEEEITSQLQEARRRRELYLLGRKPISAKGKTGIIVDDGIATGLTMKAAIKQLRRQEPKRIIVAVPVAPEDTIRELGTLADQVVVLYVPAGLFGAVGSYYENFDQVTDEEVVLLLKTFNLNQLKSQGLVKAH